MIKVAFVKPICVTVAALALLLGVVDAADAVLVFFADRAAFNLANPGLPVEGFENTNDGTVSFTGPLSSTTSNPPAFDPGDILPGITFVDNPGPNSGGLFVAGPGQSSNPTAALGQNFPATDALDILLSPGVTAIAFDIFQNFGGGAQSGSLQDYSVLIFDSGNGLLGATIVIVPSGNSGFFGVQSSVPGQIARVIVNNLNAFDVIDTVAFGGAALQVPEPASIVLLVAALGIGSFVVRRRRGREES